MWETLSLKGLYIFGYSTGDVYGKNHLSKNSFETLRDKFLQKKIAFY